MSRLLYRTMDDKVLAFTVGTPLWDRSGEVAVVYTDGRYEGNCIIPCKLKDVPLPILQHMNTCAEQFDYTHRKEFLNQLCETMKTFKINSFYTTLVRFHERYGNITLDWHDWGEITPMNEIPKDINIHNAF